LTTSSAESEATVKTGPAHSKFAFLLILATVFLDTIGFGIIIPVTPALIVELTGEGLGPAATYGGWLLFLYAAMQFIFAPIIGNLSDHFGRRPVILFSLFAFGIDYLIMGFAPTLFWLFVGRLLAGIAGGSFVSANAYIADITEPDKRAGRFGLIGAAWGLGFICGPVIGGLLGEFGSRVPFFVGAGTAALTFVFGYFALPESLPPEKRRAFTWARANGLGTLKSMRRFPVVFGLFGTLALFQIAHDSMPAVWTFYTIFKFDWTTSQVGLSMGMFGLCVALVQGGLTGPAVKRFGERRAALFGLTAGAIGFFGFAFASTGWMLYAWILPWSLMGLAMAAVRGLMSSLVPEDSQGELQGAMTAIFSLSAIVAPLFMTQLFRVFTAETAPVLFPGAPFLAAGLMMVISVLWFQAVVKKVA
jgi:MFS transporter, DHA1 family, tetracycline resistance protein